MDKIEQAFLNTPREVFLPSGMRIYASEDKPISIGYGQTNSQPSTVRQMLEWLDVKDGDKVLDVGSGSGWTSALLSYLVGEEGTVDATEIVPELVSYGRKNCEQLGLQNVTFHQADTAIGWPDNAPYDKILVSASADMLPAGLVKQLKTGVSGKMVIPVQDEILEVSVDELGEIFILHHPGFLFVPLIDISNPTL